MHGCLLQTFGEPTHLEFDGKQANNDVLSMTDRPKDSDLSIELVFGNADVSKVAQFRQIEFQHEKKKNTFTLPFKEPITSVIQLSG